MDEYISREETVKAFCEKCKGYYDGHCIHRGECDVDVIETAPSEDVIPFAKVKDLQSQIADLKRCIKSLNSDYLTGYISALLAVEGMIDIMLGGSEKMTVYCDRTTCDNNCDCECVLDIIHVDENGECLELTDNPYKDGDTNG